MSATRVLAILALVALRLVAAAFTPITFDEAYYWTWSKHLAGGYYDHPPMVAVVIRLGTLIAGDSEFGVRLVSILLALPMSWAIYQAAAILFGSRRVAASSAILLNITLMAAVGTMIVTPDAPLLVASSFLLFALAKVLQTGRGVWWLAVGAAAGCALLSKYTALFFGPAILIWLVAVPKLRHWLISPWLYLGGLVALLLFAPVILWNAEHHWVSFIKQMGRARIEDFRPVYIAELIPTQIAFATPLVWMLGAMGLYALYPPARRHAAGARARQYDVLGHRRLFRLAFAACPRRSQLVCAGLSGVCDRRRRRRASGRMGATLAAPGRLLPALGGAVGHIVVCPVGRAGQYRQCSPAIAATRRCAASASVGAKWLAKSRRSRARAGATCVLALDYSTTSWLAFYLPKGACVAQHRQRIRWVNMPEPGAAQLAGKLLYVYEAKLGDTPLLKDRFGRVARVGEVQRQRGPLLIETYALDVLERPKGEVFDRSPPPELR